MAAFTAQPVLGAPSFLRLHELPSSPQDALDAWTSSRRSTVELRAALEMKSDFSFVEDLVSSAETALAAEGLDPAFARSAVAELLCDPSLALSSSVNGVSDIAHAVLIRSDETSGFPFDVLLSVRVTVLKRHVPDGETAVVPSEVTGHAVTCFMFEMEGGAQLGELMSHYVELVRDIGPKRSKRTFPHTVVILGDLLDLATDGAPQHWKDDLILLADAFDASVTFGKGAKVPDGAPKKLMRLFTLDPYAGKLPTDAETKEEIEHVSIDSRNQDYVAVFHQMAAELHSYTPDEDSDPFAPRELLPGQNVYHRKVGNSGGGYDNFNKGSKEPCSHGKGFKRYFNSDQAVKGFERRYTNFEPGWMYHCAHGGCGVYAVFCPPRAESPPTPTN